jgi:tetratricopeptide (TPR) repeat protein
MWQRMRLAEAMRSPLEIMDATTSKQIVLQEFQPLTTSLEWELSRLHWQTAGTLPFAENEVPFLVNNSGRLSEDAATLLFHNCIEAPPTGALVVLELGAGCGLFARHFLTAFQALCNQYEADFARRLKYVVSDGSSRSVADWATRGIFAGYEPCVHPVVCNADDTVQLGQVLAEAARGEAVRAVFANYVFDVLASQVIRRHGANVEEMQIRTLLVNEPALLREYTAHTGEELRMFAASPDPAERAKLIPLTSLFDFEVSYRLIEGAKPQLQDVLSKAGELAPVLVNTGALECLAFLETMLCRNGFVLINDYGPTDASQSADYSSHQRFGRTTAQAINFPVFDALTAQSWFVEVPEGDAERAIHSRLLLRSQLPGMQESFRNRFSIDAQHYFEAPLTEAREHGAAGRTAEALESLRTAIARAPRDWRVLGEAAEFVGLRLKDFASGAELVRAALELNPWYSTWLWNVLGDCLYCQERYLDAHEAYLQAQRINPMDPRTLLNLAYTLTYLGHYEDALRAIGSGLAGDAGIYRERLLDKQNNILAATDLRRSTEHNRCLIAASRLVLGSGAPTSPATELVAT